MEELYNHLKKELNIDSARSICEFIETGKLFAFLFLLIKNKNTSLLQYLWLIFRDYDYIRDYIHGCMIELLLVSINDNITFFEMIKWYEEFGCEIKSITPNVITVIYIKSIEFPQIKSLIVKLINNIDISIILDTRSIFFIYDEVNVISPYIKNEYEVVKKFMVRSYWFDAVNTLIKIQKTVKLTFFNIGWYLLSVPAYNEIMTKYNKNFDSEKDFSSNFIKYICTTNRWEYIPSIITKLSNSLWNIINSYFYHGSLSEMFVIILFHQLKKHSISIEKLKSNIFTFNSKSPYVNFLKENKYYTTFVSENNNRIAPTIYPITDGVLEASVTSVSSLMSLFDIADIDTMYLIAHDCSIHLSKRYITEIKYIDSLLENNELGWNTKLINNYTKFKSCMNDIICQINYMEKISTLHNSFVPFNNQSNCLSYKLRIINDIISMYSKLTHKIIMNESKNIYESCVKIKNLINNELSLLITKYIPYTDTIHKSFIDLCYNSANYNYSKNNYNHVVLDLLKNTPDIQKIVQFMLNIMQVPIQDILPILQHNSLISNSFALT